MSDFILYIIAAGVCVFSFLAVTARSIFHCAMALAMALLSIAGIYFYLEAQFLGVIQVLVYVGGILTLFVFAIKLTAHDNDRSIRQVNKQIWFSALIAGVFFLVLLRLFSASFLMKLEAPAGSTTLAQLGQGLMTSCALPFEFMSVILLGALVGAIVIGKVRS